jgi:hypothetical protein
VLQRHKQNLLMLVSPDSPSIDLLLSSRAKADGTTLGRPSTTPFDISPRPQKSLDEPPTLLHVPQLLSPSRLLVLHSHLNFDRT